MAPRFLHLRTHSAYSLLEGAIPVRDLPRLARAEGMPAVALTDTNNLFAALEFSEEAAKAGIQPIIGCQLDLGAGATRPGESARPPRPLVLLARDATGWANLMALASAAHLEAGEAPPQVTAGQLAARAEGLICLTGGAGGPLGTLLAEGQEAAARALAGTLAEAFGDRLYVEIGRHGGAALRTPEEEATEPGLVGIAHAFDLPLVATNDVQFAARDFHEAHDALLCIADGTFLDQAAPRRRSTPEHFFKGQAEMAALFADLPEALESTVEIARRCAFRVPRRDPILPRFAEDEVEALRRAAREGLARRLAAGPAAAPEAAYRARLDYELDVIIRMNFAGYFLIVADFIQWAKARGIPVGPGRGSGAGSVVAWALTITDLDPLRYNLLFERFLNPERRSMPDFDIDFCMDRREEVIAYVRQRYGADRVAHIITFGALLSKAAVRDVGRVLQMPFGQVDRLAKMIPMEGVKPVSVAEARRTEPRLAEAAREEVVARLLDIAERIEGLYRNAATHAAGVVIGDRPLVELVPLYRDPRAEMPATQFNMKWVEAAGLVKFDFLGLKTLTVIRNALDLLRARGVGIDIGAIPLDDQRTFELYASANVVAVFQVESQGMRDALRRLRPTSIEDIIALVALYRPGPMENIPKFCNVKNGREPRESLHPSIDHILAETQGIIVYQEQVMQIAQVMAGYSLGRADNLRRAMGKKIRSEMERERPQFVEGCVANGIDRAKAEEVFDLLAKFADYGFNKSHAAAYALVSYQTAWLKANHPVEFMAAVMNCDIHLTDKLNAYALEVRRLGIPLDPPCVNRSAATFAVRDGRILYALGAVKGVGVAAMRLIEAARGDRPFAGLGDFARRVDLKRVGRRPLEMLARAGAFDALDRNRRRVLGGLDLLIAHSAAAQEARRGAQVSLFGEAEAVLPEPRLPEAADWEPGERLGEEQKAIGFYISGHPLDDLMGALGRRGVLTLAELARRARQGPVAARIAGAVAQRKERKSARGARFAWVQISDPTGAAEVTVFSDLLEATRALFEPGARVLLAVEAELQGEQLRLLARQAEPALAFAEAAPPAGLRIHVAAAEALPALAALLRRAPAGRGGPVGLVLLARELPGEVELDLGRDFEVGPRMRSAVKSIRGVELVEDL